MIQEDIDCWNHALARFVPPGVQGAVHYINILKADRADAQLMRDFLQLRARGGGFYKDDEWIYFSGTAAGRLRALMRRAMDSGSHHFTEWLFIWPHVQARWARKHGLSAAQLLPALWMSADRRDADRMLEAQSARWCELSLVTGLQFAPDTTPFLGPMDHNGPIGGDISSRSL